MVAVLWLLRPGKGLHIVYSPFHIIITSTSQITTEYSLSFSWKTSLSQCRVSALLSFVSRDKRRKRSLLDDQCRLDHSGRSWLYFPFVSVLWPARVYVASAPIKPCGARQAELVPVLGLAGTNGPWAPSFMWKWLIEPLRGTLQWMGPQYCRLKDQFQGSVLL